MDNYWTQQRANARTSLAIFIVLLVANYWIGSEILQAVATASLTTWVVLSGPARRGEHQAALLHLARTQLRHRR